MSTTKTDKGTFQTQNTYGRVAGPESPDINTLRNQQFQIDPTIGFRAGAAKRDLKSSFLNPMGGYTTPQIRDATLRAGERNIDQQAGMENRAGQYDVNNQTFQKNAYLAGLTAPPLVQTSTSGTQTGSYKTPFSAKILPLLDQSRQAFSTGGPFAGVL